MADLTFEQIDAHIQSVNLADFQQGGEKHFTAANVAAAPGDVLTKICGIYHIIKPILSGILQIPFIPAKWKDAIKLFMTLMDTLCP